MATRSATFLYGLCALYIVFCSIQVATAVKCLVCPGNKLSNCAPTKTDVNDHQEIKVTYVEENCTACGKLVSWNPQLPTAKNYVGLRRTVRPLTYKYCATTEWVGCYKSESAVTTSIECVCNSDGCNQAGRQAAGPWVLTAPLLLLAWAMAA